MQLHPPVAATPDSEGPALWSGELHDLLVRLNSDFHGLSIPRAAEKLSIQRAKSKSVHRHELSSVWLFLGQLKSPITIILIIAAVLSLFLSDPIDAIIILSIVFVSAMLGFWQEYQAAGAVRKMLSLIRTEVTVVRDSREVAIPSEQVVSGDIVLLSAGTTIPGDGRLVESKDLHVVESSLTGETFPVDKEPGILPVETPLAKRSNAVFQGTHVISGSGKALIVSAGMDTVYGQISQRLELRHPETDFEKGIREFGYLLTEITLVLVIVIFAINIYFHKPAIDAFLFSLALAVGLTPQLLPAIISVNLANGARKMAAKDVIVRRLSSIENFGSMNVLCSDKTGTLTEGVVRVDQFIDAQGHASEKVFRYAATNSMLETGFPNPIDDAIRLYSATHTSSLSPAGEPFDIHRYKKLDESPYDFVRKRLSVLVDDGSQRLIITKGAFDNVLAICTQVEIDNQLQPISSQTSAIRAIYDSLGRDGLRTLGVACRLLPSQERMALGDESAMTFLGFIVLQDPPKSSVGDTIRQLTSLGVALKMITGDNRLVASHVAHQVGLSADRLLTGSQLRDMSDEALLHQVNATDVFAEVEPNQKERIILAYKKAGNVVGYIGDGINDATALRAADVGISVDQAVDVAKEAADIVLLKQDLNVLTQGIHEGRVTFANTMKYIFMATSANFGNMFSMAGASLFLNFLPLLPKQILLTNVLTDLPEMAIGSDDVDPDSIN